MTDDTSRRGTASGEQLPHAGADQRLRVTHHGAATLGDGVMVDCAVLEDGRRGYVMRSLQKAVGIRRNFPLRAFEVFLSKIAPNSLKYIDKTSSRFEVRMPNGATGFWVEAGILTEIASGIIDTALEGRLQSNQRHMIQPCRAILKALAKTGEVALIDEATGYQYHRAPNALQDLFSRLICQSAADWERRFPADYYAALCRLFGIRYEGTHRPLPAVIGAITQRWVYDAILPKEIMAEIRARRRSEKLHQWLTQDGGLPMLERQIHAVTLVAGVSVDYRDFEAQCGRVFPVPGAQMAMIYPQGHA